MKRLLMSLILLTSSSAAMAIGFCMIPYVGVEAGLKNTAITSLETGEKFKLNMLRPSLLAGIKLSDHVSFELGGYVTPIHSKSGAKFRFSSYFANLLGYVPVTNTVSLLGGIGLGHVKAKVAQHSDSISISKGIPRVIAGAEYAFTDMLAMRVTGTFEQFSKLKHTSSKSNNAFGCNLGLVLSF